MFEINCLISEYIYLLKSSSYLGQRLRESNFNKEPWMVLNPQQVLSDKFLILYWHEAILYMLINKYRISIRINDHKTSWALCTFIYVFI